MKTRQKELQALGMEIEQNLQSEKIYEKIQWGLSIILLIVLPVGIINIILQITLLIQIDARITIIFLFCLFFLSFFALEILRSYVLNSIHKILKYNEEIINIDLKSAKIEDTLEGFDLIKKNLSIILVWKETIQWALFYRKGHGVEIRKKILHFLRQETDYIYQLISNLKSDLTLHIEDKQDILEQAKSEVEKLEQTPLPSLASLATSSADSQTLTGGLENGLNQISELQQARLDRQIEQFEELQKVLVKI